MKKLSEAKAVHIDFLDPRGETPAAWKVAARAAWLPKSKCSIEPIMENGKHVMVHMRERRYLHPKSSRDQIAKYNANPWKMNKDGTEFMYEAYAYNITMPRWLAMNNGYEHRQLRLESLRQQLSETGLALLEQG